jgi:hypothetical protein
MRVRRSLYQFDGRDHHMTAATSPNVATFQDVGHLHSTARVARTFNKGRTGGYPIVGVLGEVRRHRNRGLYAFPTLIGPDVPSENFHTNTSISQHLSPSRHAAQIGGTKISRARNPPWRS